MFRYYAINFSYIQSFIIILHKDKFAFVLKVVAHTFCVIMLSYLRAKLKCSKQTF